MIAATCARYRTSSKRGARVAAIVLALCQTVTVCPVGAQSTTADTTKRVIFPALGKTKSGWTSPLSPLVAAQSESLRVLSAQLLEARQDSAGTAAAESRARLVSDTALAYALDVGDAQYGLAIAYDATGRNDDAFQALLRTQRSYSRVPEAMTWRRYALTTIQLGIKARTFAHREAALNVAPALLAAMRPTLDSTELTYPEQALGAFYGLVDQPAKEVPLLRGAVARAAARYGVGSIEHRRAVMYVVLIYGVTPMDAEAEAFVRRYLVTEAAAAPRDDSTYISALRNAARAFEHAEQPVVAESLFTASLNAYSAIGRVDSRDYFEALIERGSVATRSAAEAVADLRRGIEGLKRHPLHADPALASALTSLASALQNVGAYSESRGVLEEALEARRISAGAQSLAYVDQLLTMARFELLLVRDEARSRQTLLRAARIFLDMNGTDATRYSSSEAVLYARLQLMKARLNRRYSEPRPAVIAADSAVRLLEAFRGPTSPETIEALDDLAGAYLAADQRQEADSVLTLLDKRNAMTPAGPLRTRRALNVMDRRAVLAAARGDQQTVIALNRSEHERFQRDHPGTQGMSAYMSRIASAEAALGDADGAMRDIGIALREEDADFARVAGFTSSREMLAHAASRQLTLATTVSFVLARPAASRARAVDADTALAWVLRTRGIVLSAVTNLRRSERAQANDPAVAALAASIRSVRLRLGSLALGARTASLGVVLDSLGRIAERQEASLARMVGSRAGVEASRNPTAVTPSLVRARLGANAALVEFLRYTGYEIGAPGRAERRKPKADYVAFVARRGMPTTLIELGDAEEIDAAVTDLREAQRATEDTASFTQAARALHSRVMAPLAAVLRGLPARAGVPPTLYLVPDGELTRVPFEALVDSGGRAVIDRYAVAYLSSGRDLLAPSEPLAKGTVVFAGPAFNLSSGERRIAAAGLHGGSSALPASAIAMAEGTGTMRDLRGQAWVPLAGASAEALDITTRLAGTPYAPLQTYSGAQALEEQLYAISPPRVLHLATHGFFVPSTGMSADDRARCDAPSPPGSNLDDVLSGAARGMDRLRCADDPLLRSGIVLAGANTLGDSTSSVADGWVLAAEIASMDLHGTELVVLSACETGLGDVRVGEGVYGLRRAFELAGARNVLMSLYKVPDAETRELLADFYSALGGGLKPRAAFRVAQLKQRVRHPQALYWASFVMVGRD